MANSMIKALTAIFSRRDTASANHISHTFPVVKTAIVFRSTTDKKGNTGTIPERFNVE